MAHKEWRVFGVRLERQWRNFFTKLHWLFPNGSMLVLRGSALQTKEFVQINVEQIQLQSRNMLIPITDANMVKVAELLVTNQVEFPEDIQVYHQDAELMHMYGYDTANSEFYISPVVPESAIKMFCGFVPCLYKQEEEIELDPTIHRTEVWKVESIPEVWQAIGQLHLLFSEEAVISIPIWCSYTDNNSVQLDNEICEYMQTHATKQKYVHPWTRKEQDEELMIQALMQECYKGNSQTQDVELIINCEMSQENDFPDELQMEISHENIKGLVSLIQSTEYHGIYELYIRIGRKLVMYLHSNEENYLEVSTDVPEENVNAFCSLLNCCYTRAEEDSSVGAELVDSATS